jgi:hypothetical protein
VSDRADIVRGDDQEGSPFPAAYGRVGGGLSDGTDDSGPGSRGGSRTRRGRPRPGRAGPGVFDQGDEATAAVPAAGGSPGRGTGAVPGSGLAGLAVGDGVADDLPVAASSGPGSAVAGSVVAGGAVGRAVPGLAPRRRGLPRPPAPPGGGQTAAMRPVRVDLSGTPQASRRLLRRFDTWTVFKVSLVFYLLLLVIVLASGVVVWSVAVNLGFIADIDKAVRSLADDRSFTLHPGNVLLYSALTGAVLALFGTLLNVIASLLYNLISDVVGGVQIVVVSEPGD